MHTTLFISMHHIPGNKSPMRSIEVPIDRAYPGALPVNFPQIAVYFYGQGWPSKWEKAKKKHSRQQVGMIACDTRPQNFMARVIYRSIHLYKISDRYDSPNPFKNFVTELVRALAKYNSITSIFLKLENRGKNRQINEERFYSTYLRSFLHLTCPFYFQKPDHPRLQ